MKKRVLLLAVLLLLMLSLCSCGALLGARLAEGLSGIASPISLHYKDGEVLVESLTATSIFIPTPKEPQKEGYTFEGWYLDNDSFTLPLTREAVTERIESGGGELSAYAKWSANSYTVTLSGGGESVTVTYGEGFTLPPPDVPQGKVFYGWGTTKDGESIRLTDAKGVSLGAWQIGNDCEAVPLWTPATVKVLLDAQGGELKTESLTLDYGAAYGTLPTPTFKGYVFDGWFDEKGNKINPEALCEPSRSTVLLRAKWLGELRTVRLDYGLGTGEVTEITLRVGEKYGKLPKGTREGYTFLGWGVSSNDILTADSPSVLHAEWTFKTVTVTLYYQGGEPMHSETAGDLSQTAQGENVKTVVLQYGKSFPAYEGPSKTGHDFGGWYTAPTGGKQVVPTTYTFKEDTVLYARWEPRTYTVSFSALPSTEKIPTVQATYGKPFPTLRTPTREGYVLVGWRYGAYSNEPLIVEGETLYTYDRDITLSAVWAAAPAEADNTEVVISPSRIKDAAYSFTLGKVCYFDIDNLYISDMASEERILSKPLPNIRAIAVWENLLAVGLADGTLQMYEISNGELLFEEKMSAPIRDVKAGLASVYVLTDTELCAYPTNLSYALWSVPQTAEKSHLLLHCGAESVYVLTNETHYKTTVHAYSTQTGEKRPMQALVHGVYYSAFGRVSGDMLVISHERFDAYTLQKIDCPSHGVPDVFPWPSSVKPNYLIYESDDYAFIYGKKDSESASPYYIFVYSMRDAEYIAEAIAPELLKTGYLSPSPYSDCFALEDGKFFFFTASYCTVLDVGKEA